MAQQTPRPGGRERHDGFRCKHCYSPISKITNTWTNTVTYYGVTKTYIKRRRVCIHCGLPFTTIETIEDETNPNNPEIVTPPPLSPPTEPSAFIKPNKNQSAANTSPKKTPPRRKRKKGKNPYL